MRRRASEARAWTVARKLRARRGWRLDGASFQRAWSVEVGTAAFEVAAHVSLFFAGPGMVVSLKPSTRANADEAVEYLRCSLGDRYWIAPRRDGIVTKVLSDKPRQLLAEIARVEHVFGARAARRLGPSPRSQDDRRWHVVEALRASSWQLGSLSFSREVGDMQRDVSASIGVLVDSSDGRPGLSANFASYVPKANARWTQFCDDTATALKAKGFLVNEQSASLFHAGRWTVGLSSTRALKQADVLDELFDSAR